MFNTVAAMLNFQNLCLLSAQNTTSNMFLEYHRWLEKYDKWKRKSDYRTEDNNCLNFGLSLIPYMVMSAILFFR